MLGVRGKGNLLDDIDNDAILGEDELELLPEVEKSRFVGSVKGVRSVKGVSGEVGRSRL